MYILDVITTIRNSFPNAVEVYTSGSCYKFYLILKAIFPKAKAYYNSDHVITRIGDQYYDITGEVQKENHLFVDHHYSHKALSRLTYS